MRYCKLICLVFCFSYFAIINQVFAAKNDLPVEGKGYVGNLPELTRDYGLIDNVEDENTKPSKSIKAIESKDFNSEAEIKPAPNDDPAFVNIILKSDKTSKYANDLNEFIIILENLYDTMDENSGVQLFNAKVYYFNKNVEYFRDKYLNKPESSFLTYKKLMELNTHTKSIALLRTEAAKFNPYLSYGGSGYIYNPNNINEQLDYLKTEIRETILLLRDSI